MTPNPGPDFSLFALLREGQASSLDLAGSAALFDALLQSTLDFLTRHRLDSVFWVKLPPFTAVWETLGAALQQGVATKLFDGTWPKPPALAGDAYCHVLLEINHHLEREFFFLVSGPELQLVWVAQTPPGEGYSAGADWRLALSFDPQVVNRLLKTLQGDLAVSDQTPESAVNQPENYSSQIPAEWASALTQDYLQRALAAGAVNAPQRESQELLSTVLRELSLPLTNIKTALRLLESMQNKREQRQRYLQVLQRECSRQNALFQGIQELLQTEAPPEPLNQGVYLEDCVPGVVSTYQPLAEERGLSLGYTIPAQLPPVAISAPELRTLLQHLLHNSLKFTPPQGKVHVWGALQGKRVELRVTDTGVGMEMSDIPKVFNRFYRGRRVLGDTEPGAGLGLTISQRILQRRGAAIRVNSHPGRGSEFQVLLPIFSPETFS
ncbi:MAG: HAMP domain-containing sensor histidine kinase [Cyanobacteriota bacterium]|nr:HAMP domain-containing sensor histidine kinase [Cyanobacteriota bacterium]